MKPVKMRALMTLAPTATRKEIPRGAEFETDRQDARDLEQAQKAEILAASSPAKTDKPVKT